MQKIDFTDIRTIDRLNNLDVVKDATVLKQLLDQQAEEDMIVSITEKEFKDRYLPVLYSCLTAKTKEDRYNVIEQAPYQEWLRMTTNNRVVNIIDNKTGEKLYTAPALFMSTEVDIDKLRSIHSQELGQFTFGRLTELIIHDSPFIADKKLEHYLNYVKDKIFKDNNKEVKDLWKKLYFKYYPNEEEKQENELISNLNTEEVKINPLDEMDW